MLFPLAGQTGSRSGDPDRPPSMPALDLERLLRPPSQVSAPPLRYGGQSRETWVNRFGRARLEIEDLEHRIAGTQDSLREAAPSDWGFTPTGGGQPSDPEVLRLRARLRRDRQTLETAEQRLRDLEVEASLAGVPDAWMSP